VAPEGNLLCAKLNGIANMNALALLADVNSGGQIEQIARTFGVDWPHLIAQIISFCIVCALLQRFAYRPVLAMLEERRQRIAKGLANADQIKAELARIEAQRQETMAQVNVQATRLIEEARAAAVRVHQQETQRAIAAAEQIVQKAREATEREHDRMLAELKREVGRLIVQTTAVVIGKILTPEDQQRLAEETAKQLAT
jgi:F-type H+-transporting ATPase subunit b